MLDLLRSFSKGWLAKVLIALLVVSFGIWGVSGSLFFGNQTTVVEVGETQVDAVEYRFAYDNQLVLLSQRLQRRITRQEADALGLRQNTLSMMVAGAVLDESARKMGLGVSDESLAQAIADDPSFRDLSGNFSRNALRNALRNTGLTEDDYIESRKRISMRNQIIEGTASSLDMPKAYLDALGVFENERRRFEFTTLGAEVAGDIGEPGATALEDYYQENLPVYMAPAYRKIAVLSLQPQDLARPEEITEDEIVAAYDSRKDQLRTAEQREVEQLVLTSGTADTVRQQLADGVAFEEIVTSQGKSLADINLGLITRSEMPDEAIAEAAFAAALNEPSDVIEGVFGPVIVRVVKIEESSTTPLEEVRDEIRNEIAEERAIEDVFSLFNSVEDERGAGETVLKTGETLKLETRVIDAVDARGRDPQGNMVSGVPQLQALVQAAFQAQPGDNTQAIEIGENGFLWFDVLEIQPERQQTLDEVRDTVISNWKRDQTEAAIEAQAEAIVTRVSAGSDFNAVLGELLGTDSLGQPIVFETTEALNRIAQSEDFPAAAVRSGFSIAKGKMMQMRTGEQEFVVFRVSSVETGGGSQIEPAVRDGVNAAASEDILNQVVDHLQSREAVQVNQSAVELALSAGRGRPGH